jgi:hypothetical protein
VTWRKPIVFGLSFGILLLTLALVLRRLPAGRLQWWLAVPVSVASLLEYAAIASQRWRGRPSHFNEATAYDSAVFGVMALCVAVVVLVVAVLLAWTALPPRTGGFRGSHALRLAVVVGLAGVLVSGWVGGRMIAAGEEVVAVTGAVPGSVVLGAAGSAKLAHAVGQHGLQVLIGLALVLEVTTPTRRAVRVVALAGTGYAGVLAGVTAAALRGESWLSLPPSLVLPAGPGLLLLAWAASTTLHLVHQDVCSRRGPVVG